MAGDDEAGARGPRRYKFVPRRRAYAAEERQQQRRHPERPAEEHPLSSSGSVPPSPRRGVGRHADPLRSLTNASFASAGGKVRDAMGRDASRLSCRAGHLSRRLNWKEQKADVLARYTTSKGVPVTSRIVEDDDVDGAPKVITQTDKAKARLEQLEGEDRTGSKEQLSVHTQRDLIAHCEAFATDLETVWSRGEKVKSLRIVIQACKMLCTVKCPQMYPSLFVLIAKVLDVFGGLVYERIYQRAVETGQVRRLPTDFTGKDVSPEAKEMCRNWFFKVASIRELIPRVLVEMALWRCNRYVVPDIEFFSDTLERFARQCRGVGDTIIAHHMRFYLARKGVELAADFGERLRIDYVQTCIDDVYYCNRVQIEGERFMKFLAQHQMSQVEFLCLFSPTVRWLMETVSEVQDQEEHFTTHLETWAKNCGHGMVLEHVIGSFPTEHISAHLAEVLAHVRDVEAATCPKHRVWAALGRALVDSPPLSAKERAAVLQEAWGCATSEETDLAGLVGGACVWAEFAAMHMERRHADAVLGDLLARVSRDRGYEQHQQGIENALASVCIRWGDDGGVFALESFLPLMDLLTADRRARISKELLDAFGSTDRTTRDPVIIGSLCDLARTLHDKLPPLCTDAQRGVVSTTVVAFMARVDHGGDGEAQLQFLVECRRSFSRLAPVLCECVWGALRLLRRVVRAHGGVVKSHTKRLGAFVKACIAYCHVTVPSIPCPRMRVQLFLNAGAAALTYGFLPQGETLLSAAVTALADAPLPRPGDGEGARNAVAEASEAWVLALVPSILGVAVVAPGSPTLGGLWLFDEVISFAEQRAWEPMSAAAGRIYTATLAALSAACQDRLPYHFPQPYGAPSNDDLFAGDEALVEDAADMASMLIERGAAEVRRLEGVLAHATTPPPMHRPLRGRIALLAVDLFDTIVTHGEMTEGVAEVVAELWGAACRNIPGAGDPAIAAAAHNVLRRCQQGGDPALVAATERLPDPPPVIHAGT